MNLIIEPKNSEANGQFSSAAVILAVDLEGRKKWLNNNRLRFETTEANLRLFRQLFPTAIVIDQRPKAQGESLTGAPANPQPQPYQNQAKPAQNPLNPAQNGCPEGQKPASSGPPGWPSANPLGNLPSTAWGAPLATRKPAESPVPGPAEPKPRWRMTPRPFQLVNFERFKSKRHFAIFSDPGTGKTKTMIDLMSHRFLQKKLQRVFIFSPKGVHIQWIEEQFPLHLWDGVPLRAEWWNGKNIPHWMISEANSNELQVFTANVDMVIGPNAFKEMRELMRQLKGETMCLIDESHLIKNATAKRSEKLRELGSYATQRAIMTGTPIATNLMDEWAQFKFIDEGIIGIKYKTAFQNQFCRMGGFQNKQVIGHRNLEAFKALTAPHIFRATKAELGLADPIRKRIVFEMTDEQKKLIKELRDNMTAQVNGKQLDIWGAAVLALRMQQISCGFISNEGVVNRLKENPRLEALEQFLDGVNGKVIIWCRFQFDIRTIATALGKRAVTYYGPDDDKQRLINKKRFLSDSEIDYLVANPQAIGTGTDGLQTICSTAVYYSNSFKYIDRRQSEDRIDRMGSMGPASYIDLVARGSPDSKILRNLENKKSLSNLALDDLVELLTTSGE